MSSVTARKIAERFVLAREIESHGNEMSPCSRCARQNRKCIVDTDKSTRCAECVRSKQPCDVKVDAWSANVPSTGDWEAIAKQKERLEEQEEEAMAKILRLQKQCKLLLRRKAEMAKCGLKFLDELDEAEEAERKEAEARQAPSFTASEAPSLDPNLFEVLPSSFWQQWDVGGGTPPVAPGN
jgi:hypothetical protein